MMFKVSLELGLASPFEMRALTKPAFLWGSLPSAHVLVPVLSIMAELFWGTQGMMLPDLAPCLGHLCQRLFRWVGSAQVQNSAPACKVTLLLSVSPHQHPLVDVALH